MNAGYYDEARAWRGWLLRAAAGSSCIGVTGKRWVAEREVPWLYGYGNSKPARIGNAPVALRDEGLTTISDFVISAGQRVPFVLTCPVSFVPTQASSSS
jgi:hypothetical protein